MCWYENVSKRIVEKKVGLQRLNLIAMIGIMSKIPAIPTSPTYCPTVLLDRRSNTYCLYVAPLLDG